MDQNFFSHSDIKVKIKKGIDFSIKELKSLLQKMGVDISETKNIKSILVNLYDHTIKNDCNKIKIIDLLKQDSVCLGYLNQRKINLQTKNINPNSDG